jgi:hypothetical protein
LNLGKPLSLQIVLNGLKRAAEEVVERLVHQFKNLSGSQRITGKSKTSGHVPSRASKYGFDKVAGVTQSSGIP